jgi:hypothetical protein
MNFLPLKRLTDKGLKMSEGNLTVLCKNPLPIIIVFLTPSSFLVEHIVYITCITNTLAEQNLSCLVYSLAFCII